MRIRVRVRLLHAEEQKEEVEVSDSVQYTWCTLWPIFLCIGGSHCSLFAM